MRLIQVFNSSLVKLFITFVTGYLLGSTTLRFNEELIRGAKEEVISSSKDDNHVTLALEQQTESNKELDMKLSKVVTQMEEVVQTLEDKFKTLESDVATATTAVAAAAAVAATAVATPTAITSSSTTTMTTTTTTGKRLLNVREMKEQMRLPCNYVHDGFYLMESNEIVNQVYSTLMTLNDDDIPVIIECGGHDGITKSTTLKASRCLQMNTLLIEASLDNYNVLKNSRPYDWTVNKALCEEDFVYIQTKSNNSGENKIATNINPEEQQKVQCTSIDAELDQLKETLPIELQDKFVFLLLVLDVEGFESIAIKGNTKYKPLKAILETAKAREGIAEWAEKHELLDPKPFGKNNRDTTYNFDSLVQESPNHIKTLFYGARNSVPRSNYQTSVVSPAYMFYGEEMDE